jgi:hypothetical protein
MKPKVARIWLARKRSTVKGSLTSRSVKRTKVWGDGGLGQVVDADAALQGERALLGSRRGQSSGSSGRW